MLEPARHRSLRHIWLPWAGVIGLLVVLPFSMHLSFSTFGQKIGMADKSRMLAQHVEQLIGARPDTWRFEVHRLEFLLALGGQGPYEANVIRTAEGEIVAEAGDAGPGPRLTVTTPLYDGAWVVGEVRIERGLIFMVPQLGVTIAISLFLGWIVYIVALRTPLRAVTVLTDHLSTQRDAEAARRRRAEEQLQQARKLEAIATLASGMAHSLNNMLTPITMLGEVLRAKAQPGSRDREMLDRICESAGRAAGLVGSVLAFGRSGRMDIRPVRIEEILDGAEKLFRPLLPGEIHLEIVDRGRVEWVLADPNQTEAALLNAMGNARDVLRGTGGTLTLTLDAEEVSPEGPGDALGLGSGVYAVIRVTDDGPGMSPEVAQRAFEPFFSTKEMGKGTGLGLFTAFGILRSQGGTVVLDSREGEGTTVSFYLPACPAPEAGLERNGKDAISS